MVLSQNNKIHPLILVASLIVVIACLYWAESFLKPLALSVLLAFLLSPVVKRLQKIVFKRVPAVILTSILAFGILGIIAWTISSQIKDMANDLPRYRDNIRQKIIDFRTARKGSVLAKVQDSVNEAMEFIRIEGKNNPKNEEKKSIHTKETNEIHTESKVYEEARDGPILVQAYKPSGYGQLLSLVGPLMGPFGYLCMVIVFVIFILIELPQIRIRIIRLIGYSRLPITTNAFEEAGKRIRHYLLVQLLLNTGFGIAVSIVLSLIKVPYALVLGFIAGFLRFIPFVGVWCGAIFSVVISLAVFDSWIQPLLVGGLFIILELIYNVILEPRLYGYSAGVSPFPLLVSIAFWTWLWGPVGLLLATPLTTFIVVLGKCIPEMESLVILLGDQPIVESPVTCYQRLMARDPDEAVRIIDKFLKFHSIEQVYDEILIPALCYAKRDYRNDLLAEGDRQYIFQAVRDMIEDLSIRQESVTHASTQSVHSDAPKILMLGYPACDEADEIALLMLSQLLDPKQYEVKVFSDRSLFSEVISFIEDKKISLVCISTLPPDPLSHVRLFSKRLHNRFPNLKISVGRWGSKEAIEETWPDFISKNNIDQVSTTLLQSKNWIQQLSSLPIKPLSDLGYEGPSKVTLQQ